MEIYIKCISTNETIQIPILPSSYSSSGDVNDTEVNINNKGTVIMPGKRGLHSFSFSSMFPKQIYNFEHGIHQDPSVYVGLLETWRDNREKVQLIVTEPAHSETMLITEFSVGEEDGTGDVYYSIAFKEYRGAKTKRTEKSKKNKTYKVKKGDTWYTIARKTTGQSLNAAQIAKKNHSKVTKKPKAGKKVKINVDY